MRLWLSPMCMSSLLQPSAEPVLWGAVCSGARSESVDGLQGAGCHSAGAQPVVSMPALSAPPCTLPVWESALPGRRGASQVRVVGQTLLVRDERLSCRRCEVLLLCGRAPAPSGLVAWHLWLGSCLLAADAEGCIVPGTGRVFAASLPLPLADPSCCTAASLSPPSSGHQRLWCTCIPSRAAWWIWVSRWGWAVSVCASLRQSNTPRPHVT